VSLDDPRHGHGLSGLFRCATSARTPGASTTAALSAEQCRVLAAVAEGRIDRGYLLGDLEPYLLDGREVIKPLRVLVLHRLVVLRPIGPPDLTGRGRRAIGAFQR